MSPETPSFGNHGLGNDANKVLAAAYAIACERLYRTGRAPTNHGFLAKTILEAAQLGERDPEMLAHMALNKLSAFHREVTERFGLIPNFFVSAPDAPEILERLWSFAKAAYLDNPMPSLFKERLFVFLSRFCRARYCIIRHCGFLIGQGYSSGDSSVPPQPIEQVIRLLKTSPPWRRELEPVFKTMGQMKTPINWPRAEDVLEDAIFALSALIFVEHAQAERARQVLRHALGGRRFEFLLAFLAFIRTAHFWTLQHPGLEIEDDMRELMTANKELAALLLEEPDLKHN